MSPVWRRRRRYGWDTWREWRRHGYRQAHKSGQQGWGRPLFGAFLFGFGIWHIVDSVASHWVLGIHRIKLDSPNPLMWDLIWFTAFGVVPLVAGSLMLRGFRSGPSRISGSAAAVLLLGLLTGAAGAWSLKPPPDQPFTTVVFAPGTNEGQVWSALSATRRARLVLAGLRR